MRVRVEPEAATLIERLSGGGWLVAAAAQYTNPNTFAIILDKHLKEVAEAVGLDNLSTYYARHTWATLARNEAGIAYTSFSEELSSSR
jgi:integrase